MRTLCIAVCLSVLCIRPTARCQDSCPLVVPSEVDASREDLSLADLLSPGACPAVIQSARQVRLGASPVDGSVHVFEGDQVREILERVIRARKLQNRSVVVSVPDRVTVRGQHARSSCAGIEAKIFAGRVEAPPETDCGGSGRIPEDAPLALISKRWDAALHSWVFSARCTRSRDCVPFLIRVQGADWEDSASAAMLVQNNAHPGLHLSPSTRAAQGRNFVVHPGQKTLILWDQNGIRLTVPAICMDSGRAGDTVRARIERGNRIVRAVVVSSGVLRAES